MTALGWVAVKTKPGHQGCDFLPFRISRHYGPCTDERQILWVSGYRYLWPLEHVSESKRPTGDLYRVIGLTRETRDGSTKLVLRASAPAR